MTNLWILFFVSWFFAPVGAAAHGDSPSLETETGAYLIDIGYDREGIRPDEEVMFDFDLITAGDRPAFVPFQVIEVHITQGDETVVDEELPNDGKYIPTLPVTFTAAGDYEMHVAYMQSGAVVAQSTFDLQVEPSAGTAARTQNIVHYLIAAALIGFACIAIVRSYLRRF